MAVVRLLPLAHLVLGEIPGRLGVERLREGMAERRIVRKPRHVFRELFVVSDREDIAVLARVDELRHTADVRADGRAARAHTLENGVREGLGH